MRRRIFIDTPVTHQKNSFCLRSQEPVCGSFWPQTWNSDGGLIQLDEYDRALVKNIPLKPGEQIFRYFTERSLIMGMKPMIKVNFKKGLVYFLEGKAEEIRFQTIGVPIRYLRIVKTAIEQ